MSEKIEKFNKLKTHLVSLEKNGTSNELKATEATDIALESLGSFLVDLQQLRKGTAVNSKGKTLKARDISLNEAIKLTYGCNTKTFLTALGIHGGSMSINEIGRQLGHDNVSLSSVEKMLFEHSEFMGYAGVGGSAGNTTQVPSDFRFLIPELIGAAIRYGYEHSALYPNWISQTIPMSQRNLTMPQILRGDTAPAIIGEGGDIPLGSVAFGKKNVKVFKVGTGFSLTDELIAESSLDLLSIFLQEVGNDMAIGADVKALDCLINGEQADGSESMPVVGVNTIGTLTYKDMKRVFTRMKRLNNEASRVITSENDGIDITSIDRFEGFNGQTRLADIKSIIGVPDMFDIDTHVPPTDQVIFVNPQAMVKLSFRGLTYERQRNPKNQKEEIYVSDQLGFSIVKRDARVGLDKSVAFSSNGFPAYMDIDSRITQAFKTITE